MKFLFCFLFILIQLSAHAASADNWIKEKHYVFHEDWFEPEKNQVWLRLIKKASVENYLEVGVHEGRSVFWVAHHLLKPNGHIVAIDNFTGQVRDTFMTNLSHSGIADRTRVLNQTSTKALPTLLPSAFDLIYIDGAHDMKTVLSDYVLAWPLLKVGGYMIMDDDFKTHHGIPNDLRPEKAIEALLFAYRTEIEIHQRGHQAIIRKRAPRKNSCSTCSHFGQYVFEWYDYVLTDKSHKRVLLTEAELAQLQKILNSSIYPAVELDPKHNVFKEKNQSS